MPESVVLLHGFSGTRRAWDGVIERLSPERYLPLALDLPGHGEAADAPPPITFAGCVEHVLALSPTRFVLCGYSLGGRIALHLALAAPERVERLVLVSTTAGIVDPEQRASRRAADLALAAEIEREGVSSFARRWAAQPLFSDQPPDVSAAASADRVGQSPEGLAASLRGVGTGAMAPLWGRLGELTLPVGVVVGERDTKFQALGRRIVAELPAATLHVIGGAGHAVQLEAPEAIARLL